MQAAHPTSMLAPPLIKGCGHTPNDESIEPGTEGNHENKDDRAVPVIASHHEQATPPRKDGPPCECFLSLVIYHLHVLCTTNQYFFSLPVFYLKSLFHVDSIWNLYIYW